MHFQSCLNSYHINMKFTPSIKQAYHHPVIYASISFSAMKKASGVAIWGHTGHLREENVIPKACSMLYIGLAHTNLSAWFLDPGVCLQKETNGVRTHRIQTGNQALLSLFGNN